MRISILSVFVDVKEPQWYLQRSLIPDIFAFVEKYSLGFERVTRWSGPYNIDRYFFGKFIRLRFLQQNTIAAVIFKKKKILNNV